MCIKALPGLGAAIILALVVLPTPHGSSHLYKSAAITPPSQVAAQKEPSVKEEPAAPLQKRAETKKAPRLAVKPKVEPTPPVAKPAPRTVYAGTGDPNLDYIVQHESSGNPYAVNYLGACGLFQALPCSKLGCSLSNIQCQISWGRNYAITRYGSTYNAYLWWISHSWW